MAQNELVYRVIREALDDSTTVHEILTDVEAAVESYATGVSEDDDQVRQNALLDEMKQGQQALGHLTRTLDWLALDEDARAAAVSAIEPRPFLVTQTETFRIPATSADDAIEKLEQMDADAQNEHYAETTNRFAEEI